MASILLIHYLRMKSQIPESGTILETLQFEAGGDASEGDGPVVMSCGGMHIHHGRHSSELEGWRPMIHTMSPSSPVKVFSLISEDTQDPFLEIVNRECLN